MGSSDDVTPVTKGFDDDIQQQVGALGSVSFHWLETAGACSLYFRRLLWSRCETKELGEEVKKNDPGMM